MAQEINQNINNPEYLVARYGGEEFALILPNTDIKDAEKIVKKIQKSVNNLDITHFGSNIAPRITLSFGIASTKFANQESPQVLINQADEALYQAKRQGRNCYYLSL